MAYQSLNLSIFLSFQQFFHLISSASISATVFKFCIHNEDNQVYYCKRNQDSEIYFCLLFLFFSFFYHSNVMNMEIFVKDFSGTSLPRIFEIRYKRQILQVELCIKNSATYCISVPLFVHFSFFPIKFVWPVMTTAGGM